MTHVIVTGPESTGKSTLARALAAHYGGVFVPEYPRGYLEAVGRLARPTDFPHFVEADRNLLAAARANLQRREKQPGQRRVIVQDTGVEVLKLWHEDKFGPSPEALGLALRERAADVYLLCRPDLPWEYDPLREDPHRRAELFTRLRLMLDELGRRTLEVRGQDESRLADAIADLSAAGI